MNTQKQNRFAVIGHPIAHTMSPFIHSRLFSLSGKKAQYCVLDLPSPADCLSELKQLDGFNITIPHKQTIIPYLDALDQTASFFHSVNTVKQEGGRLTGFNTDGTGFCKALEAAGIPLNGHTVILGAGGAARALAFEAALQGGTVTVAAREHSLEAARRLCCDLEEKIPGVHADARKMDQLRGPIDLLANATPVGMYPNTGVSPVPREIISQASCVFDAVYNPNETAFLKLARQSGKKAVGGMSMLVWQAAEAHRIWYGAEFDPEGIAQICSDAVIEMKREFGNVILCGFMGSGKTTIGKLLAQELNREFIDLDQWIEKNEGMTVAEIFERRGEPEFRRLERQAAETLGQKSRLVIAAGGGTLTNPSNAAALRENGIIVFLDASLNAVRARLQGDKTRPLLAGPDREEAMKRLYTERTELYRAAADFTIPADQSPEETAAAVKALFQKEQE